MRILAKNTPITINISDISPDKSISHRCAIFALLSDKKSTIKNYLMASDTIDTLKILEQLGAKVVINGTTVDIYPTDKIIEPNTILDCGNSGTAMRLLLGFLSNKDGFFVLSGDRYLNNRPMDRICNPLKLAGAIFDGRENCHYPPISVRGKKLDFFKFDSNVSSAQVKTAMILAALSSNGCEFSEPYLSRDHTEKILSKMGADIKVINNNLTSKIIVKPFNKPLLPIDISVPNDPSSAFFFAVAAAIIPGSRIILKNMLLNKTRIEAYEILRKMGVNVSYTVTDDNYEVIGDILVEYNQLKSIDISENISWLIDEVPALAIAFALADGKSSIKNAGELRVKESDRIKAVCNGLRACKIVVREFEDGFEVIGSTPETAIIDSFGDHRIAMSFAILGLKCGMIIEDDECINTSFPKFKSILRQIGAEFEN